MNKEVEYRSSYQKRRRLSRRIKKVVKLSSIVFLFISIYFMRNIPINSLNLSKYNDETIYGGSLEFEISTANINISEIVAHTGDIYHRLSMDDSFSLSTVGAPKIPFKTLKLLLPHGKGFDHVEIELGNEKILEGTYRIEPAQAFIPIESDSEIEYSLKQSIYDSADIYPENIYSFEGIHILKGYRILVLNIFPVRYIPNIGRISYFEDIKVKIILDENPIKTASIREVRADEERVMETVCNPEQISTYRDGYNHDNAIKTSALPSGTWDYVIITNNALKNSNGDFTFQDLANYKSSNGIQTTIVTVEEIYANYTGVDDQEKIRNFIIDAYTNWGIEYVLLGGDADGANLGGESEDAIVPARGLSIQDEFTEVNIPSDLYYAALDGNWNNDNDDYWGEPGEYDPYAEVYVGRAPVDSEVELSNFVRKTIAHAESDDPYLTKALMVGEDLGWVVWGADSKDEIRYGTSNWGYTTAGFPEAYNVSTLYDRDHSPDWTKDDLIPLLNEGVHMINHLGHSGVNSNMKMSNADADTLTNDNYFLLYSQGCYNGAFDNRDSDGLYHDYDSIAEHFLVAPNGSFALIVNSRYGWGSYYTTNGPSQRFDREFFDAIFGEGISEIGKVQYDSKEDNVGVVASAIFRWVYYESNLLGDPTAQLLKDLDPELKVTVDVPIDPSFGTSHIINASINNRGLNNESNVEFNLYFNDEIVNSTIIPEIQPGESYTLQYKVLFSYYGLYNFTASTPLIPGEIITLNNVVTEMLSISHDQIVIDPTGMVSGAMTWNEASQEDWCSVINDVYVIEDLFIDCKSNGSGIVIAFSNVTFLIDNCTIVNADATTVQGAGIKLWNTQFGTILGNKLEYNGAGIYIGRCSNINISGNIANNNLLYGLAIFQCYNNISFEENTVNNNHHTGIILNQCENITLSNSDTCSNYEYGLHLYFSNYINFTGGAIKHNKENGIHSYNSSSVRIEDCLINYNEMNGIYSSDESEKTIINNNTIKFNMDGIRLLYDCNNATIINNNVNNNSGDGVYIQNGDGCIISNNTVNYNGYRGISISWSYNSNITDNIVNNNPEDGLDINDCDSCLIFKNIVNYNGRSGIAIMDSHDNIISNNSVNYNILSGINVQWKSSNNYISNNSVNFNKMDGINLGFVDDNYIVRNFIRNNVIYGLDIDSGSDNNTIYENIFINNEQNARDYGTDNQWDNGTIGNYWDDYTGVDANDDGIGDLPYNISGTAGSQDRFPIFQDSDEDDDDGGDDGGDDGIPNPGESIPGYDIVFLIGALSCIILIVLRKQGKLKTLK